MLLNFVAVAALPLAPLAAVVLQLAVRTLAQAKG